MANTASLPFAVIALPFWDKFVTEWDERALLRSLEDKSYDEIDRQLQEKNRIRDMSRCDAATLTRLTLRLAMTQ
jgi:hypothetical protein